MRFQVIYFNNAETGEFSHVPKQWKRVERVIPTFGRSELQQSHLENCEWLMLKILALDATGVDKCNTGYLYIDDVKIVEIGLADEVKITPGAATKGFDGKSWTGSKPGETKTFTPIGGPKPIARRRSRGSAHARKRRSTHNLRLQFAQQIADSGFVVRMGGTASVVRRQADACLGAPRARPAIPTTITHYLLPILTAP